LPSGEILADGCSLKDSNPDSQPAGGSAYIRTRRS
jgi:hypothetical protein